MANLKKFVGEQAYNIIKNMAVDGEALRAALITSQNARNVFSELSEFEIKSLCSEISNSGMIGKVRDTTKEEIISAFNKSGYDQVIFDDEVKIAECKKYYAHNEIICTYNNLKGRMNEYHMVVAIKANIDNIKRSTNPQREDEYGTSILNIQIAKNGSHMSIKNRYNHTVQQPDSTFNNNLNMIYMGLQNMVLGYYGFASLNNQKQYYNNIVNIGGIYLKYHTERNNIYFGAFTLDGMNGARYTDTSRYYITQGKDRGYCPLILDFKNKKAIDLTGTNGKTPLISKLLKDGILSSANKEQADTITAFFPETKKELLQVRRNALKYIAQECGYDFQKPHKISAFCGRWTANSIGKASGENTGILFIVDGEDIKVCELKKGTFEIKDLKGNYKYDIDYFFSKGDFESVRKSGTTAVYFVSQNKKYLRPIKEKRNVYYGNRQCEYDKCGNNLTEAHEALNRRLQAYKKNKRASEAQAHDYTADIAEITEAFKKLKELIIEKMINAKTYVDYSKLDDVTNYKLTWLVRDIEDTSKHAAEKGFSSVEQAKYAINNVKETITKLYTKLAI